MPSRPATARASCRSSSAQQRPKDGPVPSVWSWSCMDTPTTSWPCSASRAAASEESTPPDIATTTRMEPVYGRKRLAPRGGGRLEQAPGPAHVAFLGAEVAHGQPQDGAALEPRVREVGLPAGVDRVHDLGVEAVLLLGGRPRE